MSWWFYNEADTILNAGTKQEGWKVRSENGTILNSVDPRRGTTRLPAHSISELTYVTSDTTGGYRSKHERRIRALPGYPWQDTRFTREWTTQRQRSRREKRPETSRGHISDQSGVRTSLYAYIHPDIHGSRIILPVNDRGKEKNTGGKCSRFQGGERETEKECLREKECLKKRDCKKRKKNWKREIRRDEDWGKKFSKQDHNVISVLFSSRSAEKMRTDSLPLSNEILGRFYYNLC